MVVFAAGCISIEEKPKMKTYSGNGTSFLYPEEWSSNYVGKDEIQQIYNSSSQELLVDLGSIDGNSGVFIYKEDLRNLLTEINMTFNEYVDYNLLHSEGETIYNKTRNVGGINAREYGKLYLFDEGNFYTSVTLLKKNDDLYTILIVSLDNNQYYVDTILNNFKFT